MEARIENLSEKKFVGRYLDTSFSENRTFELWQNFMPHRNEITNKIGGELYSIEIYPEGFFENFDSSKEFEKWAAVEVENFKHVPYEMGILTLPEGLYAGFIYKRNNP